MIDLGAILKRTLEFTLPSGAEASCGVPKEKDYIKFINLEKKFNETVVATDSTIEMLSNIKDEQIKIIFADSPKEHLKELLGLNVRIKSIVTAEFVKFMGDIDKNPN